MWFWWALLAAFFSGFSAILIKQSLKQTSASVVTLALASLNIPLIFWLAFKDGFAIKVNPWFFLAALGSSIVFSLALILRLSATKRVELSRVVPLTSFNPFFTYILGLIFLQEQLKITGIVGLALITVGAYVLNFKNGGTSLIKSFRILMTERSSRLFLMGVALSSVSAIFDKTSIMNTFPLNPALTLLLENVFISIFVMGFLQIKKTGWIKEFKGSFWILLLTSLIYALGSFCAITGFSLGPVALVIGIKQMQIFFGLILSLLFFKDRPSKHTLIASALMTLGVITIKLL